MEAEQSRQFFSDEDVSRLDKILSERSMAGVQRLTKKQVVLRLAPRVQEMLEKGFTLPEIVSILVEAKFPVSRATIHATIASLAKRQKKKQTARKEPEEVKPQSVAIQQHKPTALEKAQSNVVAPVSKSQESDFNDPDA
jgi:hypothetical protein